MSAAAPAPVMPYTMRPYQATAAKKFCVAAFSRQVAGMIVLPTGCGKTRLAYYIMFGLGGRGLFLTHTDALVSQVEREVRRLFPRVSFGVVKAIRDEYRKDFVLASVQTLAMPERLERLAAAVRKGDAQLDVIVVDECHHACKESGYDRIIGALREAHLARGLKPPHVLGLTATPERLDGELLGEVFSDGIIHRYPPQEAVEDRWLVPVSDGEGNNGRSRRVVVPGLTEAFARACDRGRDPLAETAGGDPAAEEEKKRMRIAIVNATASAAVEAVTVFKRRAIVFTMNVRTAVDVAEVLRSRGIRAVYVRGDMRRAEYRQGDLEFKDMDDILDAHRRGWIDVIVNCNVLLEGYDDPALNGIVWARLTQSRSLWCQAIGRGQRPVLDADGMPDFTKKKDVIVWDLVGAIDIHGLQTAETVFAEEEDHEADPDLDALMEGGGGGGGPIDREKSMLMNLMRALSGGHTRASATRGERAAWLEVAHGSCYAMRGIDGATYTIERVGRQTEEKWCAFRDDGDHRDAPSLRITGPVTEEEAKARAEALAGAGESYAARDAEWRAGRPSPRLRATAAAFHIPVPPDASAGVIADAVTIRIAKIKRNTRGERGILPSNASLLD